jgi:hypothetical protein
MTNIELIQQLLQKTKKFSWLIGLLALCFGAGFYYIAKRGVPIYSSKATVFPLNGSGESSLSNSAISNLLGVSEAPKSFTSEASINIVELALSRRTRDSVAATKVPEYNNKTIAELLIEEINRNTGFMRYQKIDKPTETPKLISMASNILFANFSAKINKNGILEMYYSNSNEDLVRIVSYAFVKNISDFYIELKKEKAEVDFQFAVKKTDSLLKVLNGIDKELIHLDEHTFWTNDELKRYNLPKLNKSAEKQAVQQQYFSAVNNREAAAYKLQKETPIIKILDKPEGPYEMKNKSIILYCLIGLIIGGMLALLLISWKTLGRYLGGEINKSLVKSGIQK